jgi:hypothetical protein
MAAASGQALRGGGGVNQWFFRTIYIILYILEGWLAFSLLRSPNPTPPLSVVVVAANVAVGLLRWLQNIL